MSEIYVRLQPGKQPYGEDIEIVLPLSEEMVGDAMQAIDNPSPNADPLTAMLCCTPAATIVRVKASRQRAAKVISAAVTKALLDIFYAGDTEMGYKKNTFSEDNVL